LIPILLVLGACTGPATPPPPTVPRVSTADTATPAATADTGFDTVLPVLGPWTEQALPGDWVEVWIEWLDGPVLLGLDGGGALSWLRVSGAGLWEVEPIASGVETAALAVDSERAYVAYADAGAGVWYAEGPGAWSPQQVATGADAAPGIDVAVNPAGERAVFYRHPERGLELVETDDALSWDRVVFGSTRELHRLDGSGANPGWYAGNTSIAFGRLLISRVFDGEDQWGVAVGWDHTSADLTVDSDAKAHLVGGSEVSPCVWYSGANNWCHEQTLLDSQCVDPSLRIDRMGRAHIAYSTSRPSLNYARWTGGVFVEQRVVDGGELRRGVGSSMVLDPDGRPHFVFVRQTVDGGELVYGTYSEPE